jgi:hypothetical protein
MSNGEAREDLDSSCLSEIPDTLPKLGSGLKILVKQITMYSKTKNSIQDDFMSHCIKYVNSSTRLRKRKSGIYDDAFLRT